MTRTNTLAAAIIAVAAFLAAITGAFAGDRSLLNIIGYSGDSRYFAFEEFGEFDGTGGAYSHIYVVDLSTDSFLPGTPFKVEVNGDSDDQRTLPDVRAEVLKQAAPTLAKYKISNPAQTWALLGDGTPKADGKMLSWSIPNCCQPGSTEDDVFALQLTNLPMKATDSCTDNFDGATFGFKLDLLGLGTTRELHRDTSLPKSRGCATDYRLYAVVAPFESADGLVAIVSVYPFGFEGPDRRFLAIPLGQ